ncbi:MAG: glycosyltransferase family 9 protein [Proteobacteria bacterium]|nr:lipopolysaccharide heptosyltransferase family protein [Pseudomonadota bacterium]NOG60707.1 glycosyltransferase family 9 protein [Pseudomonadota bacterium]
MSFYEKLALFYVNLIILYRNSVINNAARFLFKKATKVEKILINRDGAFGDSIVAIPAINIIRQNFPDAQIDLLSINNTGISFKDIGLDKKLINNLFNIKKHQRKETIKKLREQNYDLFIQIPQNIGVYKSIRNMLLVRFYLDIKYAFGWDKGRIKSFMRLQKKYGHINTETRRFIKTLNENGLYGDIAYPLNSQAPDEPEINQLNSDNLPIVFLIGGKLQPKKWPLNHWISLAKLIGEKQKILLIGGDDEKQDAEYIKSKTTNVVNLCGKLTIPELRYIFERIKIAISLDTGAMHLCASTNAKLISLFSTRDLSNKWFPVNKNSIVIEKVVHCSFCLKTECADNICMSNILPNEVYSRINELLSE